MKRLPLPGFDAKLAIELCASGISIAERAQALINALPTIQAAEKAYLSMRSANHIIAPREAAC